MATQLNSGVGGVPISSDLLNAATGLNGGAPDIVNEQVQRSKVGFGADGFFTDVTSANPMPVSNPTALPLPTGAATETTLAARIPVNGQALMAASVPVVIASNQSVLTITGALTDAQLRATAVPISAAALPLPTGAATDAVLTGGTAKVIVRSATKGTSTAADVTSDATDANTQGLHVNLKGVHSVVPVSDNAGSLTVDAPVGTPVFVRLSDGAAAIATLPVSLATLPPLVAGTAVVGALVANQSVNVAQINGIAPLMGNGITGTGSQRVTIASDNTAFPVNATLTAETTKVIGTINIAAAQTIAAVTAITNALPVGANVIGALTANQSVNNTQINGVALVAGNGVTGTGSQRVTIASDNTAFPVNATLTAETTKVIGTVNPPALTKATQGATGFTTQDLKDAGRARIAITFFAVAPAVADTLLSLVKVTAGVAATGAVSIGVAAGKVLRITSISFSIKANAAAAAFGTLTLRQNPAGATAIGSVAEARIDLGNTAATIGAADKVEIIIPDGIEFSGTQTLGVSLAAQAITNIISISLNGFEY